MGGVGYTPLRAPREKCSNPSLIHHARTDLHPVLFHLAASPLDNPPSTCHTQNETPSFSLSLSLSLSPQSSKSLPGLGLNTP